MPSPSKATADASVFGALMRSFGAVIAVLSGLLILIFGVRMLLDKRAAPAHSGSIFTNVIPLAFWVACAIWAYRRAGWKWAATFALAGVFALSVYAFRAARYGRSTERQPFPALWSGGALAAAGTALIAIAIFGGGDPNKTEAASNGDSRAIAAVTATTTPKSTALVVTATDIPSPTMSPTSLSTDTPQPTATSRPTRTPRPTVEPTETSTPKPTRTPKPRQTPKPQPTVAPPASFEPEWISRALLNEPVLKNENPGIGSTQITLDADLPATKRAGITVQADFGSFTYYVFDSDREASEWVISLKSGDEFELPDYPRYPTALVTIETSAFFSAAIGNVVVMGGTSSEILYLSYSNGYNWISTDPHIVSGVLAEYGMKRLLRIAGNAPAGGLGASDGSL